MGWTLCMVSTFLPFCDCFGTFWGNVFFWVNNGWGWIFSWQVLISILFLLLEQLWTSWIGEGPKIVFSGIGNQHEAQLPPQICLNCYQHHLATCREDINKPMCGQPISSAPNSTSSYTTAPSRLGKPLKCGGTCWGYIRVAVRGM